MVVVWYVCFFYSFYNQIDEEPGQMLHAAGRELDHHRLPLSYKRTLGLYEI